MDRLWVSYRVEDRNNRSQLLSNRIQYGRGKSYHSPPLWVRRRLQPSGSQRVLKIEQRIRMPDRRIDTAIILGLNATCRLGYIFYMATHKQ